MVGLRTTGTIFRSLLSAFLIDRVSAYKPFWPNDHPKALGHIVSPISSIQYVTLSNERPILATRSRTLQTPPSHAMMMVLRELCNLLPRWQPVLLSLHTGTKVNSFLEPLNLSGLLTWHFSLAPCDWSHANLPRAVPRLHLHRSRLQVTFLGMCSLFLYRHLCC